MMLSFSDLWLLWGSVLSLFRDRFVSKWRSENQCPKGVKRGVRLLRVIPCGSFKERETIHETQENEKTRQVKQTRPDVLESTMAYQPINVILSRKMKAIAQTCQTCQTLDQPLRGRCIKTNLPTAIRLVDVAALAPDPNLPNTAMCSTTNETWICFGFFWLIGSISRCVVALDG